MSKKITINSCTDCPHKSHQGAFGEIMYVPKCSKTQKTLGYTVQHQKITAKVRAVAVYDGIIPKWCPLEDSESEPSDQSWWYSVEEKLPPYDPDGARKQYRLIACLNHRTVLEVQYLGNGDFYLDGQKLNNVTDWKLMPKAPKTGKE